MNFEAAHHEGLPDKSFQSSNESIPAIEEKLSLQSSSIKSVLGTSKSKSAVLDVEDVL